MTTSAPTHPSLCATSRTNLLNPLSCVPRPDRRCAGPGDLERQAARGIDRSDAERQGEAVTGSRAVAPASSPATRKGCITEPR